MGRLSVPVTAKLNRDHPLASGLRIAVPLNEFAGDAIREHCLGLRMTYSGTPTWVVGPFGPMLDFGPSTDYATGIHNLTEADMDGPISVFTVSEEFGNIFVNHVAVRVTSTDFVVWNPSRNNGAFSLRNNTASSGLTFNLAGGVHSWALTTPGGNVGTNGSIYYDGKQHTPAATGATDGVGGSDGLFCIGSWDGASTNQQGVFFLWTRELSASEIAMLHADPYMMFRRVDDWSLWSPAAQGAGAPPTTTVPIFTHHYMMQTTAGGR